MPLGFERQNACIRRIIDDLNRGADERKPCLVLLVGKTDAAGLVHFPFHAVQKRIGHNGRIQKAQGLVVFLVSLVGRNTLAFLAKRAVRLVLIAFLQPDVEQAVERIQRFGRLQAGLRQKLVNRAVEAFDLASIM